MTIISQVQNRNRLLARLSLLEFLSKFVYRSDVYFSMRTSKGSEGLYKFLAF